MQTQVAFLKTMADDYAKEAERMGTIVSESFRSIDQPATLAWPEPEEKHGAPPRKAA